MTLATLRSASLICLDFIDLPAALRYNIVEGVYMAEDLQDGQQLMTTYGQNLTVSEVNGSFMVDDATIISTNYTADNGVIHIIDKTLSAFRTPLNVRMGCSQRQ